MFVSKSMTRKVVSINPETDIFEAHEKMMQHKIRHLPVVDEKNLLVGIVTDRDIRSALPLSRFKSHPSPQEKNALSKIKVKEIMTPDPVCVTPVDTIQDVLLLLQEHLVGAFPVVNEDHELVGIISVRDVLRAFTGVMGIGLPGSLLGIVVEEKIGQLKKIVDAITEENVSFGSVLVAKHWEPEKRVVFPYLLTQNIAPIKEKLKKLGFTLLDPMDWTLDALPKPKD